ncbi:MAG: ATP-binding protein [Ruminiclostridium sp.]|nr:ATP-binding protein [Ruminiclostridium sp.]
MKNLLFICGPNGIGKTTICKEIIRKLPNSAYVDSDPCRLMNPFILNDETIPTIAKNISDLLINYIDCTIIETVIFLYGFHGRRREVFEIVMKTVSERDFNFIPFLLACSEEENIKRMDIDNRSTERKQRAIEESRKAFDNIPYPQIEITDFTVSEAAENIIEKARLSI